MNILVEALRQAPGLVDRAASYSYSVGRDSIRLRELYEIWYDSPQAQDALPAQNLVEEAYGDEPFGPLLFDSYLVSLEASRWEALGARATRFAGEWAGDRLTFVRREGGVAGLALPDDRFAWPRLSLFVDIGGRRRRIGLRPTGDGALDVSISTGRHCSLPDWDDACDPGTCRSCELKELDNGDFVCRCQCWR